MLEEFCRYI